MNLQYCRAVWTAKIELQSLQDQMESSCSYHKAVGGEGRSRGALHGDPTGNAAIRRESLRKRLTGMIDRCETVIDRAEDELNGIGNAEFRALLRWRLFFHLKWKDIAAKYSNLISADAVKKRFQRYCAEYDVYIDDGEHTSSYPREASEYGAS